MSYRRCTPVGITFNLCGMFQSLYKQSFNKSDRQEIRRRDLLLQQKRKRFHEQDGRRYHNDGHRHGEKEMCKNRDKDTNTEGLSLQLSEWLKEKPENLNDWILVPCPKGQRCLVVAENGKTKMFSKSKRFCMSFSSFIPGGGLIGSDNDYCILDCIYSQENDTFYVLDALHFFIPLVNCDAEFRFFWLKSKFCELYDLDEKYKCENSKNFIFLHNYDISDEESLAMVLQRYPLWQDNKPELDGFLFYHKKSHYEFGTTPLVCWLFPFMLPDVLQMAVSSFYKTPFNYCKENPLHFMNEFDKELARKRSGKQIYSVLEDERTVQDQLDLNTIH